ncbi:SDR family NAD(P)-dependent oxidoreductase [Ralstonia soli]|uniref:SDR family oxidoreductase n=1 Tax=Ralstonia soli TaxID=2953896 RepID=A0ABT1AEC2_9RALS|nr:SDR family NAD(P)-dependent oxidoreductase [Ralstonia soli]MCO5396730.1 SDR family oxidoreductase [Ralstonia soli]
MEVNVPTDARVAVVTGAAGGIGSAVATRLARAGVHVVVTDLSVDAAQAVAAGIAEQGNAATGMALDVGNFDAITDFFARLDDTLGRCDVLVNNAGIASLTPFEELPLDAWRRTFEINVTGPLALTQHAVQRMKQRGWGRIINIASTSGIRAGAGRAGYGTSKAALIGLTRQMAVELAVYGITANAVAPGPIETALARNHSASAREAYLRQVPMKRYGLPEEVAAAIAFFATDDAAYVTGQTLAVDGGFVIAGMLEA